MSRVSLSDTADNQRLKIQQNTFKRWINDKLSSVQKSVNSLENDFSDGLLLISLVEVLSGKKFNKYVTSPKMRIHKLENVTTVLTFLQKEEKIKLVNIDSAAIVDSKLPLILGLIWTLILHYSFQTVVWSGEKTKPTKSDSPNNRLMIWINERSKVKITNFTTDWNSGIALGALVDAISPGLLTEWTMWVKTDALKNATKALTIAEKELNIVQLIKAVELTNPNVDEMSVVTYLSQFPKVKLKVTASSSSTSVVSSTTTRYVTGRGVQAKGLRVGDFGVLTVHINASPGKELKTHLIVGGGKQEDTTVRQINPTTYEVTYEIKVAGKYILTIIYGNEHVFGSPFNIEVGPKTSSDVAIFGPGLETGVAGCTSAFVIENFGKKTEIRYTVCGPVECWIGVYQEHDGTAMTSFEPVAPGEYTIHFTTLDSEHLPNSPFVVNVRPKPEHFEPKQATVSGPGFRNNVFLGEELEYLIDTKAAGMGSVKVVVYDYKQKPIDVSVTDNKNGTTIAKFKCSKKEKHIAIVTFGDVVIPSFPFEIYVHDPNQVTISGPAISGESKVGQVAEFTVDATKTDRGDFSMVVIDDKKREVSYDIKRLQPRSFKVSFTPKSAGIYLTYIYFADNKMPNSPLKILVA
ncbi:hypothetical protein HELRODRAFT_167944 [Helobdella robusta]|uniref:Calponin-homology (CH) domain-containing protein n=1 Tax=Helobdella robusta TaxID=6412 RepID=T1EZZ8_HELRO|nr:hypothetical protein HELRODRAFT_167944 [Helobdella robusta]ESO10092.1 hypothetical protein HELRODRAFT_167944 [Helobdella robusta]